MSPKAKNNAAAEELSFEQALAAVEKIVHDLEEGTLGLSESLQKYEEGVKLLRRCYSLLEGAERKIELLSGLDPQGNPITTPFKDQATLQTHQQREHGGPRRTAQGADGGSEAPEIGRSDVDDSGGVV